MGTGRSKKISFEDEEYLMDRTHYTRNEIRMWYKIFMRDCPHGSLTRKGFLKVYLHFFPQGEQQLFYEHLFRSFDRDNSGKIDFKEFLVAISITQNGTPKQKLELAFQLYDIDGNGCIEKPEMLEIVRAIYLLVKEEIDSKNNPELCTETLFETMDVNHDGVLSKEEFISGCLNDATLYKLLACREKKKASDLKIIAQQK